MEKQEGLPSTNHFLETAFPEEQIELFEPTRAEMLKEFQDRFEANTSKEMCVKLIREELKETHEALVHLLKEITDVAYTTEYAANFVADEDFTPEDNKLFGLAYKVMSMFDNRILNEAFARVHRSNMSKLGDDGKPVRREDGKILKGPNYREPYLLDLV